MRKLNLGCGKRKMEGYINIDISEKVEPDIVRDVRKGLPFDDGSVDEIHSSDFLEHLASEDFIFVINECHRVLKPDCKAIHRIPLGIYFNFSFPDPMHKLYIMPQTFDYFNADSTLHTFNGVDYGIRGWNILRNEVVNGYIEVEMTPKK